MCGLFGAMSLNKGSTISTKLLYKNAEEMDSRGGDCVGWCVAMHNEIMFWKAECEARQQRKEIRKTSFGRPSVVGHTRFATHGSTKNDDNNHPHVYSNEYVVGAVTHNGVISDHFNIANKNGVDMKGECDSEIIARLIESDSVESSLPTRAANAVNECSESDSIALAILETGNNAVDLCLVARGNPIHYSIRNGVIYYASTEGELPDSPTKLDEGNILLARQHVGILDILSGQLDTYQPYSQYSMGRWDYGGNVQRISSHKKLDTDTPPFQCQDGFDSFHEYHDFLEKREG